MHKADDNDDDDNLVSVHIHVLVKLARWPKLEVTTSCQTLNNHRVCCASLITSIYCTLCMLHQQVCSI